MGGHTMGDLKVPVSTVMTHTVVTAQPAWTLLQAARVMRTHRISGMPVVDDHGVLVGVLSEKDVVRELDRTRTGTAPAGLLDLILEVEVRGREVLATLRDRLRTGHVKEAMTKEPATIAPGASIALAARIMKERKINRLPVVDGGRLVGIISRNDLLAAL